MKLRIPTYAIDICIETSNNIESGTILPIQDNKGRIDAQALADYEDFIMNALMLIQSYNTDIVEYNISSRSATSHYITFYFKDDEGKIKSKWLFHVRISDHNIEHPLSSNDKYYRDLAAKHNQSKNVRQRLKVKQVIVNGETFDSYDSALDEIESILSDFEQKVTN